MHSLCVSYTHAHKCHQRWSPTLDMSYFYYCLQKIKTESHWFLARVAARGTSTWVSSVGWQCLWQKNPFISVTLCLLLLGVSCDFPEHDVESFVRQRAMLWGQCVSGMNT